MSSLGAFKTALEGLIWPSSRYKRAHGEKVIPAIHDPLSTLVRLALFSLKPKGSKLHVLNNKITHRVPHSQEAYLTYFPVQDEYRFGTEDFCLLHEPIERAVEWYTNDPLLSNIFNMTLQGLDQLHDTYSKRSPEGAKHIHYCKKLIENKEAFAKTNKNTKHIKIEKFLRTLWSKEEIFAIQKLLEITERRIDESKNKKAGKSSFKTSLSAIEVILQDKDDKLLRFFKN